MGIQAHGHPCHVQLLYCDGCWRLSLPVGRWHREVLNGAVRDWILVVPCNRLPIWSLLHRDILLASRMAIRPLVLHL